MNLRLWKAIQEQLTKGAEGRKHPITHVLRNGSFEVKMINFAHAWDFGLILNSCLDSATAQSVRRYVQP